MVPGPGHYQIEFVSPPYQVMRPHTPHYNGGGGGGGGGTGHIVADLIKGRYHTLQRLQSNPGSQKRWRSGALKALNQFVQPCVFKMEGIHTLRDLLKQGGTGSTSAHVMCRRYLVA